MRWDEMRRDRMRWDKKRKDKMRFDIIWYADINECWDVMRDEMSDEIRDKLKWEMR